MELFLLDEFGTPIPKSTISDTLHRTGWSKKAARIKAKERNADLRHDYCHHISEFCSHHLVFVDESWCDNRIGFRRTGWSPLESHQSRYPNFIAVKDTKYCLLMHKTVLFFLGCFGARLMNPSLRILLCSFSIIVGDGQSRSLY